MNTPIVTEEKGTSLVVLEVAKEISYGSVCPILL